MKNNQKGFGVVEALVIVLILGLIGLGGWYVWQGMETETAAEKTDQRKTEDNTNESQQKLPAGWLEYKDTSYTFLYPDTWTADASSQEFIALESDDYEEFRPVEAQEPYQIARNGYRLEVKEIPSDSPNETIEKLTARITEVEKVLKGGSHRQIIVDGHQALWVNNEHEDTYLYTVVFYGDKRIHLQLLAKDDSNPDTVKLFDDILASFKTK